MKRWHAVAACVVLLALPPGCAKKRDAEIMPPAPAIPRPAPPKAPPAPAVVAPPPVAPPTEAPPPASQSDEATRIETLVAEATSLLDQARAATLSAEQHEQLAAADAFLDQARDALRDRDLPRASILAEKSLVLARDLRAGGG